MTDQPKPRGPLSEAEMQIYSQLRNTNEGLIRHRDGVIRDLDSALRESLAEVETERMRVVACGVAALMNTEKTRSERILPDNPYYSASYADVCSAVDREMELRTQLATTSKGSMTVERMQEQLAESDARIIANSERYAADREIWREMLLAASAENLKLRGALHDMRAKIVKVYEANLTDPRWQTLVYDDTIALALNPAPSELTAALSELVETCAQLIKARINMRDLSGPVHRVSLAHERVQAALGGSHEKET